MAPRADSTPLQVLAWPGLGARAQNPYTWLLCSHLAALGVRIRDFTPARALRGGYDVLHVHWPEKALNAESLLGRVAGAGAALAILEAAHLHGARVVWTAHNALPHESRHPKLEEWFSSAVVRRVDTVIHPSVAGQQAVEARYPELARRPHAVVPLGHFRGTYPDTVSREDARAALGISDGARVLAFLGLVRPYKNVPHLVRTVRALPPEAGEVVLIVGGAPHSSALADEVREAAGGDPRVRLALEHVPDEDVQRYLRAADLVVLPFRDITNSASALLALSFDRPVLVPALGAMGELQALAGADWVCTYEEQLTSDVLAAALDRAVKRPPGSPRLDAFEWPEIARQTLSAYLAGRR
ncbi:MAG TPA: glycosyltransferase [Gemmatimonadales bacterium]|nr:glycosyltransferase [Gemmatimonadales bacterium]